MMPETIPDIRADKGFQKDADLFAEGKLKNRLLPINDIYSTILGMLRDAYLQGGQHGFNTAWRIKDLYANK